MGNQRSEALPKGATVVRWVADTERDAELNALGKGRAQWGEGEWQQEPDLVEWRAPGSALPRLAVRNHHGNWCGYVGVPPEHALHGKRWDGEGVQELNVHGGITYGAECGGHICHVPREGEPEHAWWLGFDCGHYMDYSPGLGALLRSLPGSPNRELLGGVSGDTYRTLDYVIAECERLAAQLEASLMPRVANLDQDADRARGKGD